MTWLTPGFPVSNLLLAGLASIAAGGDVEKALLERDALLDTPERFVHCAWEALAWLPPASPLAPDLIAQAARAWERLTELTQVQLVHVWEAQEQAPHQQEALKAWGVAC